MFHKDFEQKEPILLYKPTIVVIDRPIVYFEGEINGDGDVNAKDSNVLKQFISGNIEEIDMVNADVTRDRIVDAKDANRLKRILAGS